MRQTVGLEIDQSLADEFGMAHVPGDPGTIILGHLPAGLVKEVAPEKGPGPAHVRFGRMHRASFVLFKKDAIPGGIAFDDALGGYLDGVALLKGDQIEVQESAQPFLFCRGNNDPPGSLAAMTAHLAGKCRGCFHGLTKVL